MSLPQTILVVGDDGVSRQAICSVLQRAGLRADVSTCAEMGRVVERTRPGVVILACEQGLDLVSAIRAEWMPGELRVLASAGTDDEVERALAAGVDDCVRRPTQPAELVQRVRAELRLLDHFERIRTRERHDLAVLELTQKLASTLDVRDILFLVVERVAEIARVDRCSIVLFGDPGVGYVLATSDDARLRDLPIDLANYPEIREVVASGETLVIRDAAAHPLLELVRKGEPARFNSLAIVPIRHEQGPMGVLFLRAKGRAPFDAHVLSLVSTVANTTAIALRNARILSTLRAATEESTHARAEAERRVQLFQRYVDFFESSADGMVVIDRRGRILFTNPRAREITGFSEGELLGMSFPNLMDSVELERARRLLRGFEDGVYPRGVDFRITKRGGDELLINVSFSSVLHEDNTVLFTFHDVTVERRTAVELKRTKEFLECVIDSSVDSIVSANLRGTVLLFNRAASRIFGYAPEDVIGRMRVDRLYPGGVARDVMRKIRDPGICGYGRLEDYRVDMVTADGRTIQVLLSASLVLDNGKPIGSVGIFTDIRDKLRIQSELERAQDELRSREKQAIVAELAGAAAHELNQPLTSVMGYAELLRRQLAESPEHLAALQIITTEADRMAEIVRKVGRITKYETKSYVGAQRILDLEKASAEPSAGEHRG